MRLIKFSVSFSITVILLILLNYRIGSLPPAGKFLDPFHGFLQNAETDETLFTRKELNISGLKDKVSIHYDEHLVPHIQAANNHDLYLAQGYITARFRLWQMEIQTHFAAGRLSEIFGENMLERDRLTRRKGLPFGARRTLELMQQDSLSAEALLAYSRGVNAYIKSLEYSNTPFEYKLLDYKPEDWSPLKTALLLKYMSDDLSGRDYDLENTNLVKILGKETFDLLFPERLPDTDPVIPSDTKWDFKPKTPEAPESAFPEILTRKTTPKPEQDNGSNNWAVSGAKTKNGHPILANDPHLQLNLPSIWFVVQLHGPEANTYGASLPGAPGIIIGFNDSVSWGVTNATRDVKDWYAINFRSAKRNEYEFEGKWLKTEKKLEKIKVRPDLVWIGDKIKTDTVLYTHYGPVTYDNKFPGDSMQVSYALRWTAHDAGNELKAFLLLNRAKSYEEFKEAIRHYHTPAQNFVFASQSGDIALWVQGKFPIRWKEQGKFLMDGSKRMYEWNGFIPQEQNAHVLNPPRNFVSSANQMPTGISYPYYTYDQNYQHYRNRRINNVLKRASAITVEDMMKLQNDNYNLKAAETLPWMLDSLKNLPLTEPQQSAYSKLKNWDLMQNANSAAPVYYETWWEQFRKVLWDELNDPGVDIIQPSDAATVALLRNNPSTPFTDIQLTPEKETLNHLLKLSFAGMADSLARWQEENELPLTWGNHKNSSIRHLTKQDALSLTGLQVDGGRDIVNANSGRHGASWRMVVELSNPVRAFGIYPGGQSGNPGSPFYSNFVEAWRNGRYNRLYFITPEQDFRDKILFTQTLQPKE